MRRPHHRRAAKRDAAEPAIVAALRAAGASVYLLDRPCDLLAGFRSRNHLLEVKNPAARPRSDQTDQAEEQRSWAGTIVTVTTPEEALSVIHAIRPES